METHRLAVCAEAPHHVTAFFIPYRSENPVEAGSMGAGIAVYPPARACTGLGGGYVPWGTVERSLRSLGWQGEPVAVYEPLPVGAGFATSAATATAAALSYAAWKGFPLSRAFEAAHVADVVRLTGLGDVLAISCGAGIVYRVSPGAPGRGRVDCIPLWGVSLIGVVAGRAPTETIIVDAERARSLGESLMKWFLDEPGLERLLEAGYRFSRETGSREVLDMVEEALSGVKGVIGFYAKKRVALIVAEEDRAGDVLHSLDKAGLEARILEPSPGPPRITRVGSW